MRQMLHITVWRVSHVQMPRLRAGLTPRLYGKTTSLKANRELRVKEHTDVYISRKSKTHGLASNNPVSLSRIILALQYPHIK